MLTQPPEPRVSVLMPVWNPHPTYFPQAVRSVLGQTLDDWELVIVEDPSLRSGREMLAGLDDPRVRYHANAERTSPVAQRNLGLSLARSPLVALLDADDVAAPDRLEKQAAYLQSRPDVAVLGSQIRVIDAGGRAIGYRPFPLDHEGIVRGLRSEVPLSHPSVMYRKGAVRAAGGYRYTKHPVEDYELWCRLAGSGLRFANHPEPLIDYRIHPEQLKRTQLPSIIRGILDVKATYWRGKMTWPELARAWTERMMLWVPPELVLRLFMALHYRSRLPCPK